MVTQVAWTRGEWKGNPRFLGMFGVLFEEFDDTHFGYMAFELLKKIALAFCLVAPPSWGHFQLYGASTLQARRLYTVHMHMCTCTCHACACHACTCMSPAGAASPTHAHLYLYTCPGDGGAVDGDASAAQHFRFQFQDRSGAGVPGVHGARFPRWVVQSHLDANGGHCRHRP